MANGNHSMILRSEIPEGHKILPAVWAMKQKQDLQTGEGKKWKAHLNGDGSKMQQEILSEKQNSHY